MISRTWYFKLMLEDLRKRIWMIALVLLVFIFQFPVAIAMSMSSTAYRENVTQAELIVMRTTRTLHIVSLNNTFLCFITIVLAVIGGVSAFSYLHSRQQIDFYHSIPVKREKIFICRYIDSIMMFVPVYLLFALAGTAIAIANGVDAANILPHMIQAWVFHSIYFIVLYSFTVLAMILTGNKVIGVLGCGVFFVYLSGVSAIIEGYCDTFLKTWYEPSDGMLIHVAKNGSPVVRYLVRQAEALTGTASESFSAFEETVPTAEFYSDLGIVFVISLIVMVVSLFLYKKRPSEAAGKAMAFKKSMAIIKILLVLPLAMTSGIMFYSIQNSIGWTLFGAAVGALISHSIVEIIYHFDFKKLFAHWQQMVFCIAAALGIVCGFYYDAAGYDRYLPNETQVKEASVYLEGTGSWVSYGNPQKNREEYYWAYEEGVAYSAKHMSIREGISDLLDLAADGIHYVKQRDFREVSTEYIYIQYILNNGKMVYRRYRIPVDDCKDQLATIFDNPEYKRGTYPILEQTADETIKILYQEVNKITEVSSSPEEIEKLLEAYKQDLMEFTWENLYTENPVATIQFRTLALNQAILSKSSQEKEWGYDFDFKQRTYYPIYPSFYRTLELLKAYHINPGQRITAEHVTDIQMTLYEEADSSWENRKTWVITDKDMISEALLYLIYEDYAYMENKRAISSRYGAEITLDSGDVYSFCIPEDIVEEYGQNLKFLEPR